MNLVEKIKSRQNIDPIEIFDISDTKEIVENNYNAFVNEISQMKNDEQKRIIEYNENFKIELEEAKEKDKKSHSQNLKFFLVTLIITIMIIFFVNSNMMSEKIGEIIVGIFSFCSFFSAGLTIIFFILLFIDSNFHKNNTIKKFETEKNKGSLKNTINLYIFILMELTEICKLFNNPELKQSEIVSNILALKTNYETRKFQQEMLNKKEKEIELQRKIAEYNRQQMEEQQRQTEYAKQQMQSQQRQEDLVRQEQQRRNNRY